MSIFVDIFSGIGGFSLGAYWAGLQFEKHYFSEIDSYAIEIYKKRFPNAISLGNIKNIDWSILCQVRSKKGAPGVIVSGGF